MTAAGLPAIGKNETPPFLTKLYNIVNDAETSELVSWIPADDPKAAAFTVHKDSEFARDVLPRHFKHNNFSSFVRQLNQYGFHKQDPDHWTFAHNNFRRGRPDLLRGISRRRPKPANSAPVGSASAFNTKGEANDASTLSGAAQSVNPSEFKAVVELGKYGVSGVLGELDSLKRDKDLLVRELVVTRNAETKLKAKCDTLEERVDTLERSTKQMQAFILHYFSQVLQPYSAGMGARKRKRLPPSTKSTTHAHPSPMSNPETDGAMEIGGDAASTMAVAPVPSGPSMETLLSMLQQMQIPSVTAGGGGVNPGAAINQAARFGTTPSAPAILPAATGAPSSDPHNAPVTVFELSPDEIALTPGTSSVNAVSDGGDPTLGSLLNSNTRPLTSRAEVSAPMPASLGAIKTESAFPPPATQTVPETLSAQTSKALAQIVPVQKGTHALVPDPGLAKGPVFALQTPPEHSAAPPASAGQGTVQISVLPNPKSSDTARVQVGSDPLTAPLPGSDMPTASAPPVSAPSHVPAASAPPVSAPSRAPAVSAAPQSSPSLVATFDATPAMSSPQFSAPPDTSFLNTADVVLPEVEALPSETIDESGNDLLDQFIDLETDVSLFPPLTELPQGTDIGALARQIEGLTGAENPN